MNETSLLRLKILVERAVRPVRASTARKRKIREEMLAHVTTVFAEEAKSGDEAAALTRTVQRFGDPAELTRQLQAAVPASDSASAISERLIGFPPREPPLRLAARHAFLVGALCTVALAVMIVVIGRWSEWLTLYRLPAILSPVYMGVLMFGASLLGQGMLQAFYGPNGRNWPRLFAIGFAAWLLVPTVTFACCYALTGFLASSLFEMWPLALSGLLVPLVLLIAVKACVAELRHDEEWTGLKID